MNTTKDADVWLPPSISIFLYTKLSNAVFGSKSYKEMLRSKGLTQNEYLQQIIDRYDRAKKPLGNTYTEKMAGAQKEAVAKYLSEYVFQNEQHLIDLARTDRNAF